MRMGRDLYPPCPFPPGSVLGRIWGRANLPTWHWPERQWVFAGSWRGAGGHGAIAIWS